MSDRILLIHIVTHPTRARIIKELGENENHASHLSRKLGVDRRVIRFHLSILVRNGFIDSELKEMPNIPNIYAARVYWLTEKGKEFLDLLNNLNPTTK